MIDTAKKWINDSLLNKNSNFVHIVLEKTPVKIDVEEEIKLAGK